MPIASRLAVNFILIILLISIIFTGAGIQLIGSRVVTEAQEKVSYDLNAALEIYESKSNRIYDAVRLTASRFFITDALTTRDMDGVAEELVKVKTEEGLDIFTLTDAMGKVIIRASNPEAFGDNQNHNELITAVLSRNAPVAATVIVSVADLRMESPLLAKQAFFKFIDTPMARTRDETEETNGMVLGAAAPIFDLQGHLIVQKYTDLAEHINYALEVDNLHVTGTSKVRRLIEVFINDVGLEEIKSKVSNPLKGLRVAPYCGCQILRPRKDHDDVENPQYFEDLLSTIGAEPIEYSSKARCCGGSLIITNRKAALDMVRILLQDAINHNADVIATTCPMCNVNLEVYQDQVNREFGTQFSIPVMYFTQLMGLAMGIAPRRLGIRKRLVFGASLPALAQSVESK